MVIAILIGAGVLAVLALRSGSGTRVPSSGGMHAPILPAQPVSAPPPAAPPPPTSYSPGYGSGALAGGVAAAATDAAVAAVDPTAPIRETWGIIKGIW